MCHLLHIEWRCAHSQTIQEFCRAATAPSRSRTPSSTLTPQPCEPFLATYGPAPRNPTAHEFRNFCCGFACCAADRKRAEQEVRELERALGVGAGEKVRGWGRGKREVRAGRRRCVAVGRRHEERCEALHYGLGKVGEGEAGSRRVVWLHGGEGGKGEEGKVVGRFNGEEAVTEG